MIQLKKLYLYISNAITLYDVEETKKKSKKKRRGHYIHRVDVLLQ